MVDEENLEALDFMLWMSGSQRASTVAHTSQSTVIRRSRIVLSVFGAEINRSPFGWNVHGGRDLLTMERAIHQAFRFRGRRPLRLHAPFWSCKSLQENLPRGWIVNPPDASHACENPLELLRHHVIDACILTPTQIDAGADDLLCIDLYRSDINLTIFPALSAGSGDWCPSRSGDLPGEAHLLELQLFDFLPRSCRQASSSWFHELLPSDRKGRTSVCDDREPSFKVAFLTPEMRRAVPSPSLVDGTSPRPYTERLVVLRDHGRECRVQDLIDALPPLFARAAAGEAASAAA